MHQIINTMLDPVVNFGKVTVSTGYSSGDTSIVLSAGQGSKLPDPSNDGSFNLVWFDNSTYGNASDDPNVEIVRCIARVGDTLTLMRAQEGTTASNKNTPTKTYKMILSPTKKTITDIKAEYESGVSTHSALDTGVHGVGGSTVESIAGSTSKVSVHATVSTSVHNFDSLGDAPAQTHGISRHTGTIGDHTANLSNVGTNTHDQIDTALTASAGHIAAATGIHGVGVSTVESIAGSQAKVDTHANTTTAHGSTSSATANTIIQRDASGRSKIAAPSAIDDIARKDTVDTVQTNLNNHALATSTHGTTGAIVGTTDIQAMTNKTITDSTNNVMAKSLKSATTAIDVSAATAPITGQVLTATSSTAATWQNLPVGTLPPQLLSSYWHATWANRTIVQGNWIQVGWGLTDIDTSLTGVTTGVYNSSNVNLDEIYFGNVSLLAGTYKLQISYYQFSGGGIVEILIGTTSLGTINTYGTTATNLVSEITVSLSTPISGNLRIRVNGTTSTGYYFTFGRIEIFRTSEPIVQLSIVKTINTEYRNGTRARVVTISIFLGIGATNTSLAGVYLATKATAGVTTSDQYTIAMLNVTTVPFIANYGEFVTISLVIPANYYYKLISEVSGTGLVIIQKWHEAEL